jgi:hypothetical protein
VTFTWPACTTEIWPPHMHMRRQVLVTAGTPPTVTFGEPGVQGDDVAGTHGWGVKTPAAADVAAITCGLDGAEHIPNGAMFTIGALSVIRAMS